MQVEAERLAISPGAPPRNPWEDRSRVGRLRGFFRTVVQGMFQPGRLIESTDAVNGTRDAIRFLVVAQVRYHLVAAPPIALFFIVMALIAPPIGFGVMGGVFLAIGTAIGFVVAGIVLTLLGVAIWGVFTHAALRVTGDTKHDIGRTYQCLSYSSAANGFVSIPLLGTQIAFLGWIWWCAAATVMVVRGQGVHAARAAFAVLLWPLIVALLMAALIVWMTTSLTVTSSVSTNPAAAHTQRLATTVLGYARSRGGHGPHHVGQLLAADPWLKNSAFVSPSASTPSTGVPIGDGTLDAIQAGPGGERQRLPALAEAAQPENVVAHRLGDYVFTHHGFSLDPPPDPKLWIVIEWPDSAHNRVAPLSVTVAQADGTTIAMAGADLPGQLQQQNTLRAKHNLLPLPDPATVTHAQPLVAP